MGERLEESGGGERGSTRGNGGGDVVENIENQALYRGRCGCRIIDALIER